MKEAKFKKIFKELDKLNSLANKMRDQDKKVDKVMEEIFGDELLTRIRSNGEWEDGIFAYYSNAEGHNYERFKELFNTVLNDVKGGLDE